MSQHAIKKAHTPENVALLSDMLWSVHMEPFLWGTWYAKHAMSKSVPGTGPTCVGYGTHGFYSKQGTRVLQCVT